MPSGSRMRCALGFLLYLSSSCLFLTNYSSHCVIFSASLRQLGSDAGSSLGRSLKNRVLGYTLILIISSSHYDQHAPSFQTSESACCSDRRRVQGPLSCCIQTLRCQCSLAEGSQILSPCHTGTSHEGKGVCYQLVSPF